MKKITAKFNSKCAETGSAIKKGDTMFYDYSARKCYSMNSNTARAQEAKDAEGQDARNVSSFIQAQEEAYFDRFNY